jgi:anti-sigma-K factor RskA
MKHDNPKLIDALAAEYVLGTLGGRARRRFERWRSKEWHVERRVQAWEERLSGLALRLPPMRPSPHVWAHIEKRIGATGAAAGSRTQAPPVKKRAPWQAIAAGLLIFAVLIGGFVTFRAMQGPELHELATLTAERATQPAWQLHADDDLRHIRAIAGGGAVAEAGKSYELWALPDSGAAPVSLGLMPVTGEADMVLTDAQRAALNGSSKVAVSLEPEGGSTTGAPTGPVLFVADRVKRA